MNKPTFTPPTRPTISWNTIDTVLLDMDGTLLDKYFDDYFWEKHVPQVFAEKNGLTSAEAEKKLLAKYRSVESTLQWTDLYYWKEQLDLDIPDLKIEISHLIQVHDHVIEFLKFIRTSGKKLCLVTNAHPKTLEIKLAKTDIEQFFDTIVCSEDVGEAKENIQFWRKLEKFISFNKNTTLFADDTEKVLHSANEYGIKYLLHIAKPSSKLPLQYSNTYPSIGHFGELLN